MTPLLIAIRRPISPQTDGAPVAYPFLELDQELWDRDQRRFTVLFDPGRMKRGLASLAEAGPALEEGHTYTLVIDKDWLDERGAPMKEEYRKQFHVAAADPNAARPEEMARDRAARGQRRPFGDPLPQAPGLRAPAARNRSHRSRRQGRRRGDETEWRFIPEVPWHAGEYAIVIGRSWGVIVYSSSVNWSSVRWQSRRIL
jgi:hypothetical protein